MSTDSQSAITKGERAVRRVAIGLVLLSLLVLVGWLFNFPLVRLWAGPGPITLKAGTVAGVAAIMTLTLAVTVWLFSRRIEWRVRERTVELQSDQLVDAASNQLQRGVLEGAVFGVIPMDPSGTIREFNLGAEQMLGYSREEVVGKRTPTLFHLPQEVAARAAELSAMLGRSIRPDSEAFLAQARLGKVDEREWTYVRKDGSRLPVLLRITALRDKRGAITGFLAVAQDLTNKKKAETELRTSEERLHRVLDHAECLVWEAKVELSANDWNWQMTIHPSGLYRRLSGQQEPVASVGLWYQFEIPEREEMNRRARAAMEAGLTGYEQEFRLVRGEQTIWIRESVSVSRLENGRFWLVGVAVDITENRQAKTARDEIATRLSKLGSMIPGMIFQFRLRPDGSSSFPYSNSGIQQIYRLSPDEVREDASKIFECLHPEDVPRVVDSIQASARTLQLWTCEYRVRFADGTERWLLGNSMPEREADGSVLWHGFITDITERKHAEASLHENEERLRLAAEAAGVTVWDWDIDHDKIFWDEGMFRIYGLEPTQSREVSYEVWTKAVHPDDLAAQEERLQHLVNAGGGVSRREFRIVRASDQTIRHVHASEVAVKDVNGKVVKIVGINIDITDRKAAEQALAQSHKEIKDLKVAMDEHSIVVVTDLGGRITYANDKFCKVSKYSHAELLGKSSRILNSGHHPKEFMRTLWSTIEGGKIWKGEIKNRAKDGSFYWVDTTIVPFVSTEGKPTQYVAISSDITALKQLEASLVQARDQALEASKLKSEFLATMSHEIRTPMNAIIGMAGFLVDTPLDQKQTEMAQTILGGAESLLSIINDILDFSRIEAGRMRIDSDDFDFNKLVQDTVNLLSVRAEEKQIKLNTEFLPWSGALLLGDSGRVRQVLVNLIGNAIKFTDVGEVKVTVRAMSETDTRTRLRVEIRDTGIGIPQEAQSRLFQPFVQADGSTTRRFGGTGLGLAISRQLVGLMSGEMGFESEEGRGSLFWFELGFQHNNTNQEKSPERISFGGGQPSARLEKIPGKQYGLKLLLVEDNLANRQVGMLMLEKMGCSADVAVNGQEALEMLARHEYDAVLMDCQMPIMDGYEATRRIRSGALAGVSTTVPIIALTAYARTEDRAKCLAAGMTDYVSKPIREAELVAAFDRCGVDSALAATKAVEPVHEDPVIDQRVFDAARTLKDSKGRSILQLVVNIYLDEESGRLARLEELVNKRQNADLAQEAHSFGGNAISFGGMQVRRTALELEEAARNADWPLVVKRMLLLREASMRLRNELSQFSFAEPRA